MLRSAKNSAWAIGLVGCLIGAAAGLLLGQAISVRVADGQLEDYVPNLLDRAVHIGRDNGTALSAANALKEAPCSEADLDELRDISFLSEYPRDVGRIENGSVVCTALWGRLSVPAVLPPPQRVQPNGIKLWANVPNIDKHKLISHITSQGNAIVFTSPKAFGSYERDDEIAAWILTKDSGYIYRRFGDAPNRPVPSVRSADLWPAIGLHRSFSKCAPAADICVIASLSAVDVLWPLDALFLGVAMLGALSGSGVSLAVFLYCRRPHSFSEEVRQAIDDGRLTLVYQPLVRMQDGEIVGVEALARLTSGNGEQIPPDVFIKLAEDGGFIDRVTRIVISTALKEMTSRLKESPDFHCGINLSTSDILDATLCDYLDREVRNNGLNPCQIILEVTERSSADPEQLMVSMESFRKRGYEFYLDDFGTGYSNLSYLAKLPIKGIKLDRMFTQAIGKEAMGSTIAENVCNVANALNLQLIIEGIETEEQAAYIKALNTTAIGQGWLYGKPTPVRVHNSAPLRPALRT